MPDKITPVEKVRRAEARAIDKMLAADKRRRDAEYTAALGGDRNQ